MRVVRNDQPVSPGHRGLAGHQRLHARLFGIILETPMADVPGFSRRSGSDQRSRPLGRQTFRMGVHHVDSVKQRAQDDVERGKPPK